VPDFDLLSVMVAQLDGQVDTALAHVEAHLRRQPKSEERVPGTLPVRRLAVARRSRARRDAFQAMA